MFIKTYLKDIGKGDYFNEEVNVIFNKDQLINESEVIENCKASFDILFDKTVIEQHPWVNDVNAELEEIKKQKDDLIKSEQENNKDYFGGAADE